VARVVFTRLSNATVDLRLLEISKSKTITMILLDISDFITTMISTLQITHLNEIGDPNTTRSYRHPDSAFLMFSQIPVNETGTKNGKLECSNHHGESVPWILRNVAGRNLTF
jgi:hypothetical protein